MNLFILGATGDVGREYVDEALRRGHRVTATARNTASLRIEDRLTAAGLDVMEDPDGLQELAAQHDAVLSALRPPSGAEVLLAPLTRAVLTAATIARRRVYVTGGAGPLLIPDGGGHTVLTAPGFLPDSVRPIAKACGEQDRVLDTFAQTHWLCLRPAAILMQGPRTGRYSLGRDTLVTQNDGISRISYADFAVAMLDLVELAPAPRQRLTVGW
ncbi:MAG: NAD(P)-dependent oxidoreductase [Pararhodobacter sp.]